MQEIFSVTQTIARWLITENSLSFIARKGEQGGPC